jgi:hypothetical protein
MAARIDHGRIELLTRTGLNWSDKYPSVIAALANLDVKTAYLDGELCGVDEAGLPSFANTQAATDGERGVRLAIASSISCTSTARTPRGCRLSSVSRRLSLWSWISPAFSSTAMRRATANSS